jgi:hypothetical protein
VPIELFFGLVFDLLGTQRKGNDIRESDGGAQHAGQDRIAQWSIGDNEGNVLLAPPLIPLLKISPSWHTSSTPTTPSPRSSDSHELFGPLPDFFSYSGLICRLDLL